MLESLISLDVDVKPDWTSSPENSYRPGMASTDPIRANVGLLLKAAREAAGYTQQFVADLFEVGNGTVSAWEKGGGDPGIYRLRRLAKLYDVPADALLWDESPSPEAMKVAVQYDALSDDKRKRFNAMWAAYFIDAAEDKDVEDAFLQKSGGKYKKPEAAPREAPKPVAGSKRKTR